MSRDMISSVQNDGPCLSSEANKLALTHRDITDTDTLRLMRESLKINSSNTLLAGTGAE